MEGLRGSVCSEVRLNYWIMMVSGLSATLDCTGPSSWEGQNGPRVAEGNCVKPALPVQVVTTLRFPQMGEFYIVGTSGISVTAQPIQTYVAKIHKIFKIC